MVDIEKLEKRTVRSFYDDGLTEIAAGLMFLILGAYFILQLGATGSTAGSILSSVFLIVFFAAFFLVNRLLRFFKRRITYPRTGYVAFKKKEPSPKRRVATAVVAGIISAALAILFRISPSVKLLFPAVNGLLFAVAALLLAHRVGVTRFYVLSAASAAIGVGLALAGVGDLNGLGFFYLLFGAAVLVAGLAALIVYLGRNPRPAPDAQGGSDAR
jgi:hypothetical protein